MNTRDKFHAWLATQGYRDDMQPLAGGAYPSERVQALWDGWQAATLAERNQCRYPDCLENTDERCHRWLTGECSGPTPDGEPS
jgi:hypothetical protein